MAAASADSGLTCRSSRSRPRCSCLRSCILPRRRLSIARCLAVAMSQAPGLSGTPEWGHCSSAATSASCARSSATPISPTTRAKPAMSLADSIRQTASMASAAAGRVIHHLTNFHFQLLGPESDVRFQESTGPLDGFLLRGDIVDRIAADDFLSLGEGAVRNGDLPVGEPGARAQCRRQQPPHPDHRALLRRFLPQLPDLLDERRRRVSTRLARPHNRHESHGRRLLALPVLCDGRARPLFLLTQLGRELGAEILGFEDLTDFHFTVFERDPLRPLEGFRARLHLPNPEPGHQLFGFGERPVAHGSLAARVADPRTLRRGLQPLAGEHDARLDQLVVELPHLRQLLLAGHGAGLILLFPLHHHQVSHRRLASIEGLDVFIHSCVEQEPEKSTYSNLIVVALGTVYHEEPICAGTSRRWPTSPRPRRTTKFVRPRCNSCAS